MKFATGVLLCLVLLSVFYGCTIASVNCSISDTTIACHLQDANLATSKNVPIFNPMGDPIDSPKPHTH